MLTRTSMASRLRTVRMGHRDAGFSLIEVLIGSALLSIVGALSATFIIGSTTQANRVGEQSLNGADIRVAAEQIAGLLRVADTPTARAGFATGRFEVLTPTRIVFYANIDTASRTGSATRTPPSKIDIGVDTGRLVEKIYPPKTRYTTYPSPYDYTANYAAIPAVTTVLLRSINTTTSTLFAYCTSATDPMVSCSPAANALSIASVTITLTVPGLAGSTPQTVTSTVAITGALS